MIFRKTIFILLLTSGLLACQKETTSPPTASPAITTAAVTPELTPTPELIAPAPNEFRTVLSGVLADNLQVQMELTRKGGKLTGHYFYERVGASNTAEKLLSLAGRIDREGKAILTETALSSEQGEAQTGEFKGVIDSVMAEGAPLLRFLGVWTNTRNKKETPFSLPERRLALGGFKLSEKKQQEQNKKLRLEIAARWPQLTGDAAAAGGKFNQAVTAFAGKQLAQFKKDVAGQIKSEQEAAAAEAQSVATPATGEAPAKAPETAPPQPTPAALPPNTFDGAYEIVFASPDFISVLFSFSVFQGGAHPNNFSAAFNYDLKRGVAVKLPELFAPKANYLKALSGYCIDELKKLTTTSEVEAGAGPQLENFRSWNITPLGLRFTFDPSQVGAYAAGAHEVVVPYATLKPVLKADGLLAPLVK